MLAELAKLYEPSVVRDQCVIEAMKIMLSENYQLMARHYQTSHPMTFAEIAGASYELADAMMSARGGGSAAKGGGL